MLQTTWLDELATSSERTMRAIASVNPAAVASLADMQAFGALNLQPMPVDPLEHLRVGYLKTRPYLERLRRHDPAHTSRISERDGYVYPMTPRKILRRVLDHTLDHLNQIDQWIDWQSVGAKPRPTDGWAPSGITFEEDHVTLTEDELSAWLWRIDRAIELLIHRATGLSEAQLEWVPPGGSGPLQRVLHAGFASRGALVWLRRVAGRRAT